MTATTKNDAPAVDAARGGYGVAHAVSHHCDTHENGKRHDMLRAQLARRGYGLSRTTDGAWLVCRWDRSCDLADLQAVEQFLRKVGGDLS